MAGLAAAIKADKSFASRYFNIAAGGSQPGCQRLTDCCMVAMVTTKAENGGFKPSRSKDNIATWWGVPTAIQHAFVGRMQLGATAAAERPTVLVTWQALRVQSGGGQRKPWKGCAPEMLARLRRLCRSQPDFAKRCTKRRAAAAAYLGPSVG